MKYESPQVVRDAAAAVILGLVIQIFPGLFLTTPAYEANEYVQRRSAQIIVTGRMYRQYRLFHSSPVARSLELPNLVHKLNCELHDSFFVCEARANEHTAPSSWDLDLLRP